MNPVVHDTSEPLRTRPVHFREQKTEAKPLNVEVEVEVEVVVFHVIARRGVVWSTDLSLSVRTSLLWTEPVPATRAYLLRCVTTGNALGDTKG